MTLPHVGLDAAPATTGTVSPRAGTARDLDPSRMWILGLVVDDDGRLIGPATTGASYLEACECPEDCLRDHANE